MAGSFALKRSLLNLNLNLKLLRDPSYFVERTIKVASTISFSTGFERVEDSSGVKEAEDRSAGTVNPGKGSDPTRQGMYEAKQESLDVDEDRASGMTGFMAEKVREGAEMAKETADRVGETAKQTVDGAAKMATETTEQIKEAVTGHDDEDEKKKGPNRNVDFENDRNIEDLRQRAGGYDKGE